MSHSETGTWQCLFWQKNASNQGLCQMDLCLYLPASVTQVHKNCMTELFGLDKTPEEIGQEQDVAMQVALAE